MDEQRADDVNSADDSQPAPPVVQRLQTEQIDAWRADTSWVLGMTAAVAKGGGPFSAASQAVKHVWALGATVEELGEIARYVAFNAVFGTLLTLEHGADAELIRDVSEGLERSLGDT
jgi:hypothetical protein